MNTGVDINRNFDIVWDFNGKFFDAAAAAKFATAVTPCTPSSPETYRGTAANSEAETKNLKFLQEQALHFIDVHMDGRTILVPWGFASNQTSDASKNFQNPTLHGKRGVAYAEFLPGSLQTKLTDVANFMHESILRLGTTDARAAASRALQNDYKVTPSVGLYPASGCCDDFFFSRQFAVGPAPGFKETVPPPGRLAYTIECGDGTEHGFFADPTTEFPKIEREVHAGLWGFLARLVDPARAVGPGWPFL